jgi:hypothetical protein
MKTIVYTLIAAALLGGCAGAGGPVGNIAGAALGVQSATNTDAGPLVDKFYSAALNMTKAQVLTLQAFDDKKGAEQAQALANAYEQKTITSDSWKQSEDVTANADAKVKEGKKLDAKGKKKLAEAVPYYAKSLAMSAGLGLQMSKALPAIQANPASLVAGPYKATDVISIFTNAPGYLTKTASTTQNFVTYGNKSGIDTKAASDAAKSLGK